MCKKFSAFKSFFQKIIAFNRQVGSVAKHIAVSARSQGFDSLARQIGQCRQRFATAATFLCWPGAMLRECARPLVTCFRVL